MDELEQAPTSNTIELTADLVAAYVSNNNVPVSELPALLADVHGALSGLANAASAEPAGPEKLTAAQIRKSITPDALISFEDGKSYKTLRRHLTLRGLTAEQYRTKYGLPADYPMTSAVYSATRSALAHALGLGQQRRKTASEADVPDGTTEKPKGVGRSKNAKEEV
ncbi:MucR family transcriptional regulator [Methylobacterium sp. WL103]|uniref:MucR family transcriptional regulator n=1 Tax=Methylobacterium sp. WL103 TaxID=2603891 RepID=UPI0011C84CD4|nr:MucR family transcriptional regulator [Methylobacterium sp. WL103]TXN08256.1 MucR family transcriptional regulator [Methylobacterium sp. WL103]